MNTKFRGLAPPCGAFLPPCGIRLGIYPDSCVVPEKQVIDHK
jgi:hypothetical protein